MNFKKEFSKLKKVNRITKILDHLYSQGLIDNLEEIDGLFFSTLSFKISNSLVYSYKLDNYWDFEYMGKENTCYIIGGLVSNVKNEIVKGYIRQYFYLKGENNNVKKFVIEHNIFKSNGLKITDLFCIDKEFSFFKIPMLISDNNNFLDEAILDELDYSECDEDYSCFGDKKYHVELLCNKDAASFDFVKESVDFNDVEYILANKLNVIKEHTKTVSKSIEKVGGAIKNGCKEVSEALIEVGTAYQTNNTLVKNTLVKNYHLC